MNETSVGLLIIAILVSITIFLICREVACWYFKINDMKRLLERTNTLLETIAKNTDDLTLPPVDAQPVRNPLFDR